MSSGNEHILKAGTSRSRPVTLSHSTYLPQYSYISGISSSHISRHSKNEYALPAQQLEVQQTHIIHSIQYVGGVIGIKFAGQNVLNTVQTREVL
jgi:hypothetical protein